MIARSSERIAFSVRVARPSDLAALDALFALSYPKLLRPDYPPSVLVTAVPRLARAQPRLLACGTYFVAEDAGGALVGAGGYTRSRGGPPGRADVRHVVTHADAVRQGVGRAILTRAMAEAAAAGCSWMHCLSSLTAVPFYTALGFVAARKTTVPLGPGIDFPAIEMRRDLP